MLHNGKIIVLVVLVSLAVVSSHAKCPEGEPSPIVSSSIPELEPEEKVSLTSEQSVHLSKPAKKEPCQCESIQTKDEAKTEQVVVKKVGKKFKVITITIPIEDENLEADVAATESSELDSSPSDETSADSLPDKLVPGDVLPSESNLFDVEPAAQEVAANEEESKSVKEEAKPKAQERKEKAKTEKKKYKRDAGGKKSSSKKASRRNGKEQEKKKSKK